METQRLETDLKLAASKKLANETTVAKKLSKRAKKKLDKQLADKSLSEIEKKLI